MRVTEVVDLDLLNRPVLVSKVEDRAGELNTVLDLTREAKKLEEEGSIVLESHL